MLDPAKYEAWKLERARAALQEAEEHLRLLESYPPGWSAEPGEILDRENGYVHEIHDGEPMAVICMSNGERLEVPAIHLEGFEIGDDFEFQSVKLSNGQIMGRFVFVPYEPRT